MAQADLTAFLHMDGGQTDESDRFFRPQEERPGIPLWSQQARTLAYNKAWVYAPHRLDSASRLFVSLKARDVARIPLFPRLEVTDGLIHQVYRHAFQRSKNMQKPSGVLVLIIIAVQALALHAQEFSEADLDFFERRIRPVLVEHCYECHSQEAQAEDKLRGGLLLDSRAAGLRGGDSGPAVVPGDPDESLLIGAIEFDSFEMPPDGQLPAAVIADFRKWIEDGAADPRQGGIGTDVAIDIAAGRNHWAYRPLEFDGTPADLQQRAETPIDAFVKRRLEEQGMQQGPRAERTVLLRRLYYDMIGLPPTPEEIESFVNDPSPDAYQRQVDRLLASPRFGERWGRHWLDVVRYADSITLRGFLFREAWRYRDFVVESYNLDQPYSQFVRQQIAGDLLEADSLDQHQSNVIATTFLTMGNNNLEDQDKSKLRMDVVDEQLDTIGRALLGQTIGCARCHDHKFDPIPTRDYYALAGILRSTKTLNHANVSQWIELTLPMSPDKQAEVDQHRVAVEDLKRRIEQLKGTTNESQPLPLSRLQGVVVDDEEAELVGDWVASTSVRSYVGKGYRHDGATGKGEKTATFRPPVDLEGEFEVRFAFTHSGNRDAKVPVTVWSADEETTIFVDQKKKPAIDGHFVSLGRFRFASNTETKVVVTTNETSDHVIIDAVQFWPVELADAEAPSVADDSKDIADELKDLEQQLKSLNASKPDEPKYMTVQDEQEIGDTNIHIRGNVHNLGASVPRGFLQVVSSGEPTEIPAGESGRTQLAEWIASPENSLASRVYANRLWHWTVGQGIVETPDNFGTTGGLPSHPELLDYLSTRLIESQGSTKSVLREIVLSETYQLSSRLEDGYPMQDPENRQLSRMNRRRGDAEFLMDAILYTSGNLDTKMGGPTIKPEAKNDYNYQHAGGRRAIYWPVLRNSLPDLFVVFDFANPSMVVGRRDLSSTSPQSLFLMNNPWIMQQSEAMAERVLSDETMNDEQRLNAIAHSILGRAATDNEERLMLTFVGAEETGQAARQKKWAQMIQTLYASIDFRYIH